MPAQATSLPGGWARIETDCLTVGLLPPPHVVTSRLRRANQGWTMQAHVPPGSEAAMTAWLHRIGAIEVERDRDSLLARFGGLPDSIDILARVGAIDRFDATPAGRLALTARLPRGTLEAALVTLDTRPEDRDAALTRHQEAILDECVAAGYYSIPRKATLRQLARKLGMSPTSLSLTLRRAEARIIASYVGRKRPIAPVGGKPDASPEVLEQSAVAAVVAQGVPGLDPATPHAPHHDGFDRARRQ